MYLFLIIDEGKTKICINDTEWKSKVYLNKYSKKNG